MKWVNIIKTSKTKITYGCNTISAGMGWGTIGYKQVLGSMTNSFRMVLSGMIKSVQAFRNANGTSFVGLVQPGTKLYPEVQGTTLFSKVGLLMALICLVGIRKQVSWQ